jgi:hypothetical protein
VGDRRSHIFRTFISAGAAEEDHEKTENNKGAFVGSPSLLLSACILTSWILTENANEQFMNTQKTF